MKYTNSWLTTGRTICQLDGKWQAAMLNSQILLKLGLISNHPVANSGLLWEHLDDHQQLVPENNIALPNSVLGKIWNSIKFRSNRYFLPSSNYPGIIKIIRLLNTLKLANVAFRSCVKTRWTHWSCSNFFNIQSGWLVNMRISGVISTVCQNWPVSNSINLEPYERNVPTIQEMTSYIPN